MSRDLIMDESKEIFKLDREIITFKIDSSSINKLSSLHNSQQYQALSEEDIRITNITSEFLAFRAKTTKKENYSVHPIYCIIPPKSIQTINIILYYKAGLKIDSKGHKFKFEAFVIPESQKNDEVKELFNDYIKKGIEVRGNIQKRNVKFIDDTEDDQRESNILKSGKNIMANSSASIFSNINNYTVAEDTKNQNLLMDKIKQKEEDNINIKLSPIIQDKNEGEFGAGYNNIVKFENLKKEYNQLKEQFDNLKMNEELCKKRLYNEKNKNSKSKDSKIKFNYTVPEDKEKKLSRNFILGLFLFSTLIGFYLVK
jgi:hypothetical protein